MKTVTQVLTHHKPVDIHKLQCPQHAIEEIVEW